MNPMSNDDGTVTVKILSSILVNSFYYVYFIFLTLENLFFSM